MENKKIIRDPGVSSSTVVLHSKKEDIQEKVEESTFEYENNKSSVSESDLKTIEGNKPDAVVSIEALLEKEQEINIKKEKIDQLAIRLEQEKESYKKEIYEEVLSEVSESFEKKYEEKSKQLIELINSISEKLEKDLHGVEDEVIAITFEAICKIIGENAIKPEIVSSCVSQVMQHAQDRMEMRLRVSERDFDVIYDSKTMLGMGLSNRIEIVKDDHVQYGGCIVETMAGRIDGRMEQQLNALLQLLLNMKNEN